MKFFQRISVYEQKSRWKLFLLLSGIIIISASLWYSNTFVRKIARQERQKVELWAQALQDKVELLEYTNLLFNKISLEEKEKVEVWSRAVKRLAESIDNIDPFVVYVIEKNNSVPIILTDDQYNITESRNIELNSIPTNAGRSFLDTFTQYPPIKVETEYSTQYLFYKDSKLFQELKNALGEYTETFISEVALNTAAVPVILLTEEDSLIATGNISEEQLANPEQLIAEMKTANPPLMLDLDSGNLRAIYYKDSYLLQQLTYFPIVQIAIMGIFILIAYWSFSNARRGEQNKVWVGLAKETAHQLGTPISSLQAWIECLRLEDVNPEYLQEMEKDISRLEIVTERFSKIGSIPKLSTINPDQFTQQAFDYMRKRKSKLVEFSSYIQDEQEVKVQASDALLNWVIENLTNNAIDAMEGKGSIHFQTSIHGQKWKLSISDSGCGIPKQKWKTVFEPGFSSKKRGWGLGLSLAKRIIEEFHSGKIYISESKLNEGTTFAIEIPLDVK